ncbi:DUF2617 family protein [Euzebya rosea]|uniref:DUF2617 family protein n=1 Tax=Euzebya rosea TaxID=2052804 RepID=UPI000D3EB06E|nr:DUF2617 family protein [Euzebya rosea]
MHDPTDLSPDRLTVAFGGPLQPALARATLALPTTTVEVAVLSASHQVRTLEGHAVETLACNTGGSAPGPRRVIVHTGVDRWDLAFDYAVDTVTPVGLATLVEQLRDGARTAGVVHAFPGHPHAVTAVLPTPSGDGWATWHCYPEHGRVARSTTTVLAHDRIAVAVHGASR